MNDWDGYTLPTLSMLALGVAILLSIIGMCIVASSVANLSRWEYWFVTFFIAGAVFAFFWYVLKLIDKLPFMRHSETHVVEKVRRLKTYKPGQKRAEERKAAEEKENASKEQATTKSEQVSSESNAEKE